MNSGNNDDLYDTIKEEGTLIEDPREAKEHIANYFENLSHARPGKPEYEDWTNKITEKLVQLEKEQLKLPDADPITLEEINNAIKMLKRNKANGPDGIPNEALKEADQNTRIMYQQVINVIMKNRKPPLDCQKGHINDYIKEKEHRECAQMKEE